MSSSPGPLFAAFRLLVMNVVYGALLFGSAGTLAWPQAWAYLGALIAVIASYLVIVARLQPELIAERTRPPSDAKAWDKPLAAVVAVFGPLAMIVAAGLEQRARGTVPAFSMSNGVGLGLVLAAGAFTNWAVASNRFFSALVRIQRDRGHRVVDSGPYAWVRHPGYAGAALATIGGPLALGSTWALGVGALVVVVMLVRTSKEDRTLHEELEGYAEYAERVRFRILLGIW